MEQVLHHIHRSSLRHYLLCLCFILFEFGNIQTVSGEQIIQSTDSSGSIGKLLSRLNLNTPELSKVKASQNDQDKAADELLAYYRSRQQVKHPVDRQSKGSLRGTHASEKDLKIADDALKHIFVGQPAYPSHFCGDDIDWSSQPVPDNEWVWQLNRMYFWDAMARAYWHTGEERYAQEWCNQLVDWVKKNPRDQEHHYAWRSIEAGIRGNRWTGLFQYFIDSPAFTPEVLVYFLNSCFDHASFLMTKYSSGSNWALMEAEGMAFIAITFPEFSESEQWQKEAVSRFNKEIQHQVYSDGHQRELAMGYHVGSIRWFMRTYELASMNGIQDAFPMAYMERIEKMCEVPMKLAFPDGTTTQFGDSWSGKPGQYTELFKDWAAMFDRADFLFMATEGKAGKAPEATAFAYQESGLYSMRSGWDTDAICLVLKCGPDGGGHCQPDNGTFELYAGGRHLMPDAGSFIYHGDPENRTWFRQTKVHQTMTLNGENSVYAPKLLKWEPGKDLDVLVVENKSYPMLTHRRTVLFVEKKFFVIIDKALGEGAGNVDIHFQLAPGEAIFNEKELSVKSAFPDGYNVMVQTAKQKDIQMEEEEGQVSFEYTKKQPRPAFRYRVPKEATTSGVRFVTVIVPYQGKPPQMKVKVKKDQKIGDTEVNLEVVINGQKKQLNYELK